MATAPIEVLTPGQMKDLSSAAVQGVPSDLSRAIAEAWEGQKGVLVGKIREIFLAGPFPDIDWPMVHEKLGMKAEAEAVRKLVMPPADPTIWWVPMVRGVTSNRIVAGHRNLGVKYWLYQDDLDTAVPTHDRDPNRDGDYVAGFRRTVEADEENKNKSAKVLASAGHKGSTLPERLFLGAGFNIVTGQHLDIVNWTLCTGSRSGGRVPSVRWDPGVRRVSVGWYSPGDAYDYLRSRSAISLVVSRDEVAGEQP